MDSRIYVNEKNNKFVVVDRLDSSEKKIFDKKKQAISYANQMNLNFKQRNLGFGDSIPQFFCKKSSTLK